MQVQNRYVRIQIGNKKVEKHNLIYDDYLRLFSKGQIKSEYYYLNGLKDLSFQVRLILDTLDDEGYNESIFLKNGISNQVGTSQSITVDYKFSNEISYIYNNEEQTDRSLLDGKRIIGISFCEYTYLDTTEMDLQFNNGEVLTVTREDIFTTDAICNGYEYPYHLAPIQEWFIINSGGYPIEVQKNAMIYSVGLGYQIGQMQEEYIVGEDVEIKEEDDTTFSFVLKKATDVGNYPGDSSMPSLTNQPLTFKIKISNYPNVETYPGDGLYPSVGDYKYIIIKYKFGYFLTRGDQYVTLDDEYTMSFYTNKEGILTIKDKIERK